MRGFGEEDQISFLYIIHAGSRRTETERKILQILATSREALGIAGETAYRVPSLPLPDPRQLHDLDALAQNDCVHLFVDRAIAAYPSFRLKEKNAPAIADICRRLDGIPLAIELASARTKVFPPEEIAARLDDRFRLLTGGSRTALERHQTLIALIEWSHNLLSEAERVLLRRLSVFAGGWTFEAAQEVCGDGLGTDMLDLLTHLVDKSLVGVEAEMEEARYRLPETIRQYARDKLLESGEAEQVRDRHLDFFIRFAETAEPKLRSGEQLEWLERLETEHDNLRTALAWSLESGKTERALQLAGAVHYFWELRGYWSEGGKWLEDALALGEREQKRRTVTGATRAAAAVRAKALHAAGWLLGEMNFNLERARPLLEESLRLWRELGDKWWIAATMEPLAVLSIFEGDFQTARARLEEGVAVAREVEAHWPLALCLIRLAGVFQRTDLIAARQILEEGVAVARKVGDKNVLSLGLLGLGTMYLIEGNFSAAAPLVKESLAEARATGSGIYGVIALYCLVVIMCQQGELEKAKSYCFELLALGREKGSPIPIGFAVTSFGFVASVSGQPERAIRLLGAFESMARQAGLNLGASGGPMLMIRNRFLETARAQLSPEAFGAARAEGQKLTLEQALALATEKEGGDSELPQTGLAPISD
jgi:predicted ATPase